MRAARPLAAGLSVFVTALTGCVLAFVRNSFTGADAGLWVVSADGGEARPLVTGVVRVLGWREAPG